MRDNSACVCESLTSVDLFEAALCGSRHSVEAFFEIILVDIGLCESHLLGYSVRLHADYFHYLPSIFPDEDFDDVYEAIYRRRSLPGEETTRGEEQAGDDPTAAENGNNNVPALAAISKKERAMKGAATKNAVGLLALTACLLLAL